jgi:hypothetical protein
LHFDLFFLGWLLMGPPLCWAHVTLSVLLCTVNGRELPILKYILFYTSIKERKYHMNF